ncbi:MAG TPA: hypothetical protein VFQ77_22685 [Pseudonocardiaceae bacterium]|jgi:hypothetical protein|nr:hypothetical protein [Pseudonocardiaceae bacterium]
MLRHTAEIIEVSRDHQRFEQLRGGDHDGVDGEGAGSDSAARRSWQRLRSGPARPRGRRGTDEPATGRARPDPVARALKVAVAELRIEAGWSAFDAGLHHHALYHFARAVELAWQASDAYCQAIALGYAGR